MNIEKIDRLDILFISLCIGYIYGYYKIYYWFG